MGDPHDDRPSHGPASGEASGGAPGTGRVRDERYVIRRPDAAPPPDGAAPRAARPGRPALAELGGRRRRRRIQLTTAVIAVAVIALVVLAVVLTVLRLSRDPFAGAVFYLDPGSSAALAAQNGATAAERTAARVIAAQPTATWLTPEQFGTGEVRERVAQVVRLAGRQHSIPVFVVYGITERDCGGFSAGGLDAAAYPAWIEAIDQGLGRGRSVVVLEPDSLALSGECPDPAGRIAAVRAAAGILAGEGRFVYLDGGHSDWLPAAEMARLLRAAGVDEVRGFALNVANTQSTAAETAYAHALRQALGGGHAVIDTSRNGNGPSPEWCNPAGRALGDAPQDDPDDVVDALLWIKVPGESDGTCNGGPPAGQWWPLAATELVANARGPEDDPSPNAGGTE